MPAYQPPPAARRAPGYGPPGTGPMTAYWPDGGAPPRGRQAPGPDRGPGSRLAGSGLLAGYSPASGPLPAYQPPADPLSGGRRVLEWLPFGSRLVLLPKDAAPGTADGELREHRDVNGGWLRPAVFGPWRPASTSRSSRKTS